MLHVKQFQFVSCQWFCKNTKTGMESSADFRTSRGLGGVAVRASCSLYSELQIPMVFCCKLMCDFNSAVSMACLICNFHVTVM